MALLAQAKRDTRKISTWMPWICYSQNWQSAPAFPGECPGETDFGLFGPMFPHLGCDPTRQEITHVRAPAKSRTRQAGLAVFSFAIRRLKEFAAFTDRYPQPLFQPQHQKLLFTHSWPGLGGVVLYSRHSPLRCLCKGVYGPLPFRI